MIEQYFDLKGRKVLVTGSTRGIGYALAKGFLNVGCEVWIHGRKASDCERVAHELDTHWVNGDLGSVEAVEKIANEILAMGELDVLINNAAIEHHNPIEDFDLKVLEHTFHVNVRAPNLLIHRLLPLLKKSSSGNILNITSIHQETPYPKHSAYSMSKAALGMLTKCLALELAPYHIRVNNFAPGAVKTEINQQVVEAMERKFNAWIPLGRVASVDEMVGTALYLCSDAASYVTGSTFYVDGGYRQNIVRY